MNMLIRLLYSLLIAAAITAFVGVGIYTFYPAPPQPAYPEITAAGKAIDAPAPDTSDYEKKYNTYRADLKVYNRNVSVIVSVCAAAIIPLGLYLRRRSDIIGEGIALGGIGNTIYAIITAAMADDRVMRFIAVTLFLAGAIVVVYSLFNDKMPDHKTLARKHA